jgi:hypothetical protein
LMLNSKQSKRRNRTSAEAVRLYRSLLSRRTNR